MIYGHYVEKRIRKWVGFINTVLRLFTLKLSICKTVPLVQLILVEILRRFLTTTNKWENHSMLTDYTFTVYDAILRSFNFLKLISIQLIELIELSILGSKEVSA